LRPCLGESSFEWFCTSPQCDLPRLAEPSRQPPLINPPICLVDHRQHVIVGVQINPAVQSHRRSLLCVTTQVTREGNVSRAEGPVRGLSFVAGRLWPWSGTGCAYLTSVQAEALVPKSGGLVCEPVIRWLPLPWYRALTDQSNPVQGTTTGQYSIITLGGVPQSA
jgi:hypothetical protein